MILDFLKIGSTIIDKIIPDPKTKAQAKLKLLELQHEGKFKDDEMAYSAIIAEAKSKDPWTSRARPSFMYVMYIVILFAIPFSIFSAFNPEKAILISNGFSEWLEAIPESLYTLFGVGFIGYSATRTIDKAQILKNK